MKSLRIVTVCVQLCCFLLVSPIPGWSRLVAETYEAGGTVEKVLADGTVVMNGEMYYLAPNRKKTGFQIQAGSQMILHYMQDGDKKIYFEIAAGRDQLPPLEKIPENDTPLTLQ